VTRRRRKAGARCTGAAPRALDAPAARRERLCTGGTPPRLPPGTPADILPRMQENRRNREPERRARRSQRPDPPAEPEPHPPFTRRLFLVMALFAVGLKLVNFMLSAMLVPPGAVQLITSLLLLIGLGYLVAYYFRRGPFRPEPASGGD
jgi:hypothetical protein